MDIQDPQYKSADGSALRIWRDTVQNKYLSEKFGRPIFDECIMLEVISPGSRDSTPVFEVERVFATEMNHPAPKYGQKYEVYTSFIEDFKSGEKSDASLAGTPLKQWSEMTRTMVAALKAQSIFTVEALASLPDTKLIVVGPDGRMWREKAMAYIENAKGSAYATSLAADLERERADKAELQAQVKSLADQVAALQAQAGAAPRAPGKAAKAPIDPLAAPEPPAIVADPLAAPLEAPAGETLAPAETASQPII